MDTGHCICCEGNRILMAGLEREKKELFEAKERLAEEVERADRRIDDLNDEVSAAEEMAEKIERDGYKVLDGLRDEKRKQVAMLRRLEFCLHGLCPVCLGIVEHKTACDLKLAIWALDAEIVKSQFVHL